ncbi:unnamed protein product [Brachionus calyciflorus]|uniref:Uncharacterized protein n=1 Tax=Brachionus calyciflorus TaxID=104777 RepID=A0A813QFZ7_9BILA|nr:unnamed protein product [Brachionus calyciflorus]
MNADAAELRRQKILKNSEKRLQLLMGVKNSENQIKLGETVEPNESLRTRRVDETVSIGNKNNSNSTEINQLNDHAKEISDLTINNNNNIPNSKLNLINEKSLIDDYEESESDVLNQNKKSNLPNDLSYKFNGYSNIEILILFSLACFTSILFYLDFSQIINHNVLLPFFTLELGHLAFHLKYLPAKSSQFQLFHSLLQLCGISQRSLKNLMIALNFLFILIDNFVIYILSFVLINLILNSFFIVS